MALVGDSQWAGKKMGQQGGGGGKEKLLGGGEVVGTTGRENDSREMGQKRSCDGSLPWWQERKAVGGQRPGKGPVGWEGMGEWWGKENLGQAVGGEVRLVERRHSNGGERKIRGSRRRGGEVMLWGAK